MANYKQHNTITIAGIERNIPAGATIIYLNEQTATSSAPDAMYLNSAVYQVTAGKVFHCIGIINIVDGTGGNNNVFSQGDTEDAETISKATIDLPTGVPAGYADEQYRDFTVASGKFITSNPSGTQVLHVIMIGYEI